MSDFLGILGLFGAGSVTMARAQGTLVFRCETSESDMLEQIYRALRYTLARYPAPPGPAPAARPAPG